MQARRDAYFCSFHIHDGFADFIDGYRERIRERLGQAQWHYLHVWAGEQRVGQLEFRSFSDELETGYVQLIYLFPEYRGTGLAAGLQAYIRQQLLGAGCNQCAGADPLPAIWLGIPAPQSETSGDGFLSAGIGRLSSAVEPRLPPDDPIPTLLNRERHPANEADLSHTGGHTV